MGNTVERLLVERILPEVIEFVKPIGVVTKCIYDDGEKAKYRAEVIGLFNDNPIVISSGEKIVYKKQGKDVDVYYTEEAEDGAILRALRPWIGIKKDMTEKEEIVVATDVEFKDGEVENTIVNPVSNTTDSHHASEENKSKSTKGRAKERIKKDFGGVSKLQLEGLRAKIDDINELTGSKYTLEGICMEVIGKELPNNEIEVRKVNDYLKKIGEDIDE